MPYDLFLGVPKHRVPEVVEKSGMTVNGWIPVDKTNLKTQYPGVYAIGDVNSVGTPKAGVFAEGAAKVAAESIIAEYEKGEQPSKYKGDGICYVEFGDGRVGKVNVDFFSGPLQLDLIPKHPWRLPPINNILVPAGRRGGLENELALF